MGFSLLDLICRILRFQYLHLLKLLVLSIDKFSNARHLQAVTTANRTRNVFHPTFTPELDLCNGILRLQCTHNTLKTKERKNIPIRVMSFIWDISSPAFFSHEKRDKVLCPLWKPCLIWSDTAAIYCETAGWVEAVCTEVVLRFRLCGCDTRAENGSAFPNHMNRTQGYRGGVISLCLQSQ